MMNLVPMFRNVYIGFDGLLGQLRDGTNRFPIWTTMPFSQGFGLTFSSKIPTIAHLARNQPNYATLPDPAGYTRLHLICSIQSLGRQEALICLAEGVRSVNVLDFNLRTPLHHAVSPQNIEWAIKTDSGTHLKDLVYVLIQLGADVNACDKHGFSPFHLVLSSAVSGWLKELEDIVSMMMRAGANVFHGVPLMILDSVTDTAELDGNTVVTTPVHLACRLRGPQSVGVMNLLVKPENVDWRDSSARTPLNDLLKHCDDEPQHDAFIWKIRRLLSLGADVHAFDQDGVTPLFYALKIADLQLSVAIISLLFSKGATVNVTKLDKVTPLHLLCANLQPFLGNLLPVFLEKGAEINAKDKSGRTPLHHALTSPGCDVTVLQHLHQAGADVTATDELGWNSLHMICSQRGPESASIVDFLLKNGCPVDAKTNAGDTPLILCTKDEMIDRDFVNLRVGERDEPNASVNNMEDDATVSLKILELLMAAGANPNTTTTFGVTPLYLACAAKNVPLTRLLLSFNADVSAKTDSGHTPLHAAIMRSLGRVGFSNDEIVDMMVKHGADVNAKNRYLESPLHYEVEKGLSANLRTVYLLLLAGDQSVQKASLLTLAAAGGNPGIVKLLMEFGADPNQRDPRGSTPLEALLRHQKGNADRTALILVTSGANPFDIGRDVAPRHGRNSSVKHDFYIPAMGLLVALGLASRPQTQPNKTCHVYRSIQAAAVMKGITIPGANLSLAEFLIMHPQKAVRFMRNPHVVEFLRRDHRNDVPDFQDYYERFLQEKAILLQEMHELQCSAAFSLTAFFSLNGAHLPHFIVDKIISYLHDSDMLSLRNL